MLKLSAKLFRLRQTRLTRLPLRHFSTPKPDPSPEEQPQPEKQEPKPSGISMNDVFSKFRVQGKKFFQSCADLKWYNWALLGAGFAGLLYLLDSKDEMYPINLFEEEMQSYKKTENNILIPKRGFSNICVVMDVFKDKVCYKIRFMRNDQVYVVSYWNQTERFRQIEKILQENSAFFNLKYEYSPNVEVSSINLNILAHIFSALFGCAFFFRGSSMSGVKKAGGTGLKGMMGEKKTFEVVLETNVKFKDVAGLDESKVEIQEFVDFLKNPAKYKKLGARIPKGVLLSGPPGTGKTMLAKACAGQAGVPFIAVSGSDFVQIFVGVGASRVRDLFTLAKQKSPSIVFIDEIDAVGRKRSGSHGSHDERDNTLNQILVEMDGFETDKNVIVMAATNRQNLLDTALIRPGRFDRLVEINLPDLEGRRQIFNVHLSKIQMDAARTKEDYARRLATLTPGFSGAQIANLCNQAAILAARNGKTAVDSHDMEMATERIIGGIQRKSIISKEQKKVVAVHESGHAVVSWFLKGADPLLKLTIIPRSKGSLGFAQYFVNETKLQTRTQLLDRICFILGGRCAEELFFGKVTNGASDDLKKAYELAHNCVVKLGMSEELGLVAYKDPEFLRPYSEQMGTKIDNAIKKILHECTQRTRQMVRKHETEIKNLSEQLFEKETLTIKQIRRILGERDFINNETYEKYLEIEKEGGMEQPVKV